MAFKQWTKVGENRYVSKEVRSVKIFKDDFLNEHKIVRGMVTVFLKKERAIGENQYFIELEVGELPFVKRVAYVGTNGTKAKKLLTEYLKRSEKVGVEDPRGYFRSYGL